ncbi:MAG TPA: hypothetical protein VFY92_02700 [Hyphomicrobiaceae bacterium]|nr:hypothetical protein [Hyphomicrobiaceae bacterium]
MQSEQCDRAAKIAELITPSDPDAYFVMTEAEARRLILATGLPLFGDIDPERYLLLDPLEAMIQRDTFTLCEQERKRPPDVWDFIDKLVNEFYRVDFRPTLTRATAEHAQIVAKRLRSLMQALDDPCVKLLSGGKPMDDFKRDCQAQLAKFSRWADILARKSPEENKASLSLEDFIKGPLANAYDALFWRDAGGNADGPFARFGAAFFEIVGHRVAKTTIVRAVKDRPRSRKGKVKQPHLRFVHNAA